jgi:arylsulfatase A-like enzyme
MMFRKAQEWFARYLWIVFVILGAGILVFTLLSDRLGLGGRDGVGVRQLLLIAAAILILACGILLRLPVGRRAVEELFSPALASQRPVSILYLTIWFALLTGLAETTILMYRKIILGRVIGKSLHVAWMAPLGEVIVFLLPGLLLFFLARRRPTSQSISIPVFLFTFMAAATLLLYFPKLHILATLALALGIAVQTSRIVKRAPHFVNWLVRYTTPGLISIWILLAAGMFAWQVAGERRALASLPDNPARGPNVLLIVLDTVRAESLSLYGYGRPTTPNLERLAKQGARFDRAYVTAPWTLPSHASMFTGQWHYQQPDIWGSPLNSKDLTLAEFFTANGYYTAGFVANTFYGSYEHGLNRGFDHYEDYTISLSDILLSSSLVQTAETRLKPFTGPNRLYLPKTAEDVNTSFLRWQSRHQDRPFFAFLNYIDAHAPYLPPKPFDRMFGDPDRRANPKAEPNWEWTEDQVQAEIDAYDGSVAYLDDQVGRLFSELEARGLARNTLVMITSDHGEQLGEHRLFDHGNSLYVQALHVPLVILFPEKVPAGTVISTSISLRNLPATVLDLLESGEKGLFPGTSLAGLWENGSEAATLKSEAILSEVFKLKTDLPEWYPITEGDMKSLVMENYHYIRNGDGREELYDLQNDPAELYDLAAQPHVNPELDAFRIPLERILNQGKAKLGARP